MTILIQAHKFSDKLRIYHEKRQCKIYLYGTIMGLLTRFSLSKSSTLAPRVCVSGLPIPVCKKLKIIDSLFKRGTECHD